MSQTFSIEIGRGWTLTDVAEMTLQWERPNTAFSRETVQARVHELARQNHLSDPNRILAGQEIQFEWSGNQAARELWDSCRKGSFQTPGVFRPMKS